jgi:IS30 family transposase
MSERHYKHLRKVQREQIEEGLNAKKSMSAIAREIGCSAGTVTREVMRNRRDDGYRKKSERSLGNGNICIHRKECEAVGLCRHCTSPQAKFCKSCKKGKCQELCERFEEEICLQISSSPHVCNGCSLGGGCKLHRYRYSARDAEVLSETRNREAREGIDCTPEALEESTAIIKAGIDKGQGLDHIFFAHRDELAFAKSTFYRHVKDGKVSILPIHLRKAVKYKPRDSKSGSSRMNIPPEVLIGRTYDDFKELPESEQARVVECDCMEGPADENDAIFTLHFKALHFQIAFKLAMKDSEHVYNCFMLLADILEEDFSKYFGILVFDRGCEFARILDIEALGEGVKGYFTDPRRANQKGSCEKNHVECRKILAKGSSFAGIGAWELSFVMSHVNSSLREAIFGKSPMELAMAVLPKELFEHLGYTLIAPDDVVLLPELLEMIKRPS